MDIQDTINTVGSAIVLLAVVAVVLSATFGVVFSLVGSPGAETAFEPAPSDYQFVVSGDSLEDGFDVQPSSGNAIGLFADGYVDIRDPDPETRNESWALAVTAEPQTIDSANSYTIYAEENATILVQYEEGNYSARYETENGSHAFVTAPASGTRQTIGTDFRESSGELRLYIDGDLVDTGGVRETVEPRNPAYEWDGTLDEFRRWDTAVGNSTHAAYADDPVQPLNTTNATHRLMFNDEDPDEIYYASSDAEFVGRYELVTGVQPPEMEQGVDFDVKLDPIRVRATAGGYLDGAPVMLVTAGSAGPFASLLQSLVTTGSSALGLIVIGVLALASKAVFDQFNSGF